MQCVYPDCGKKIHARGLCHRHYQTMRSRVRAGRASEDDLMRRGLLLPKSPARANRHDELEAFNLGSEVRGTAPREED